jgi:ABC-2 type transport system permease protein
MSLAPGSFLWLAAHDMRLGWRGFAGMFGTARPQTIALVLGAGALLLHLAAWPLVALIAPHVQAVEAARGPLQAMVACTLSWMIAQSLFGATRALFDRGDLDLLLGAPLPAARIFAAKAVAIATATFGSVAFLTLPVANVGAVLGYPGWLGSYPALIAIAMIATAIGLAIAITLFFLVGPRRARAVAQLTGAAIGGAFILGAQILAVLPEQLAMQVGGWFAVADGGPIAAALAIPIGAFRGDAAAIVVLLALATALLAAVVVVLAGPFARASVVAAGAAARTGGARRVRFATGVGPALRRKELLLMLRDPGLFAQLSLQIIYTVPVAVVLLRSGTLPAALALSPAIVVVAAQVAASLAWITVSGEDAPELIATAPVAPTTVDRAKLSAIVLPVATILALPLAGLAIVSVPAMLTAIVFAMAAAASTSLVNFWHPMPGNRRGMLRRHSQSKLIGLVEHTLAVLWAVAVVFALLGSLFSAVPIAIAAGVLLLFRHRHRGVGRAAARLPLTAPATVSGSTR